MTRPTRHLMAAVLLLAVLPSASRAAWRAEGTPLVSGRNGISRVQLTSDESGGAWLLFAGTVEGPPALGLQRIGREGPAPGWPAGGIALEPTSAAWWSLASDGAGGVFVSWRRFSTTQTLVVVQHVLPGGAFAAGWPDTGAVAAGGSIGPATLSLASDGAGGCFVAWQDFRNGYTDHQDPYVQHLGPDGVPAPGWPASGLPLTEAAHDQFDPVLAADGTGGVFAAWWDYRDSTATQYDIWAQRVNGDGSRAVGWPADGVAICTVPGHQFMPAIAGDGAGGAIVVWGDGRPGDQGVFAQRVLANGAIAPGWTANGVRLGPGSSGGNQPALLPDGAGGAFAAWTEPLFILEGPPGYPQPGQLTHVTHVAGDGVIAPGWPGDGEVLYNDEPVPGVSALAPDGAGGAVVSLSVLYPAHFRIAALSARGVASPAWPAGGVSWTAASGHDPGPTVPDGAGGVYLAWIDDARGVVGQRVAAGGVIAPGWDGYPDALWMANPAPSPTSRAATFRFALPAAANVTLRVFDVSGALVREVARGLRCVAGQQSLSWDGLDSDGRRVRAGLYFARLEAGSLSASRRVIVAP